MWIYNAQLILKINYVLISLRHTHTNTQRIVTLS